MTTKKTTNTADFSNYIKWFWRLLIGGIAFVLLLFLLASWGAFGKLPTFEELENPNNNLATEVISSDGKTLGKYYLNENRTPIKYKDLPQNLVQALIATEDERLHSHSGIDARGTLRAVVKLGAGGGASTVTQQLAKNLFTKRASGNIFMRIIQKAKEWVIAIRLERQYTKEEIISMYFNTQGFLFNATGIRSAARIYFGKEPRDLKIEESAVLVAMLKNPRQYNPHREVSKKKSLGRRNQVFKQMEKNGFITTKEKDSLQKLPLKLNFTPESHSDGYATYFREYLRDFMKKWIKNNPKPDGSKFSLHHDGLKIYTTIDYRMQKYAEQATQEHMANLQRVFFKEQKKNKIAPFYDLDKKERNTAIYRGMKNTDLWRKLKKERKKEKEILKIFNTKRDTRVFSWKGDKDTIMTPKEEVIYYKHFLRSGLISIEPQTGHVKAWVGGVNYKYFQFDAVKQQKRQVGSTFKPFVYASAINQLQLSPCEKLPNTPFTIPKGKYGIPEDWTPKNAGNKYGGELTLKEALARSVNVITARLIDMVNPNTVARLAKSAGIQSDVPANPSIALGALELSLYEMAGAYATFANKGLYIEPSMILRIEDKHGTVLEQFAPKTKEVLSEESAYVVLNLMQGVTQSGSGSRLRHSWRKYPDKVATGYPYKFTNQIAGKTGTTQNQSDGWFMGIVPNLMTGVWVGGEDRATHFAGIAKGQGASMALPIWALYMKRCYADKTLHVSDKDFERPAHVSIELNCENYGKADASNDGDKPLDNTPDDDEEPEF